MTDEYTTANLTISNTSDALTDAVFDPERQLAVTIQLYFKYAVIAVAVFGTVANALVLYALIAHSARDAKKRVINFMVINQNSLDLCCSVLLVLSMLIEVSNVYLTGAFGYFLCAIIVNGAATQCAVYGSIINLVALTLERYLKVVHPFWSKKNLKRWVVYTAMAFAWIGGFLTVAPASFIMSRLRNGVCVAYVESEESQQHADTNYTLLLIFLGRIVIFFLLPLMIFIYCYGRIVVVIRRQMRVMAGHNAEGSSQMNASQAQSKRAEWNVIKTMIIVSIAFIVCLFPVNLYSVIVVVSGLTSDLWALYYPVVFLVYLNVCMNPFIYATKHEGVRHQLARLIDCRKPSDAGDA